MKAKPASASRQKVTRILAAAHALFTRGGYGITSMDAVAAEARVGKATVYAHFGSKPELFAAVVSAQSPSVAALPDEGSLESGLRAFAKQALDLILDAETTAMVRMIAGEHARFPELGPLFFQSGPARLQAELARHLEAAMARGELRREHPDQAAVQFLALICGDLQLRAILGTGFDDAARERTLASGLDAFLRAYRK